MNFHKLVKKRWDDERKGDVAADFGFHFFFLFSNDHIKVTQVGRITFPTIDPSTLINLQPTKSQRTFITLLQRIKIKNLLA